MTAKAPRFRTAFGPKKRVQRVIKGESRTRQEFKKDCDINRIVGQFQKTGVADHLNRFQGAYGEFQAMDFHEAMNHVVRTQEMFETVPSEIRAKFGNDPAQFLDFVGNPENKEACIELGLMARDREEERREALEKPPEPPPEAPA